MIDLYDPEDEDFDDRHHQPSELFDELRRAAPTLFAATIQHVTIEPFTDPN